jgi:putative transposase
VRGNSKALVRDLKPVCAAPNREGAEVALAAFEEKWGRRYPMIGASWRTNWKRVVPFLDFLPDIRRIIYTTNALDRIAPVAVNSCGTFFVVR